MLLLADILPTGAFAAIQALQHPKVATILTGAKYPFGAFVPRHVAASEASVRLHNEDRVLTIGVIGLGPVGIVCQIAQIKLVDKPTNVLCVFSARLSVC